jgi:flagella basal body P-ring formation protein FlgA
MSTRRSWLCALALVVPATVLSAGLDDAAAVRAAIATSVSSRLGGAAKVNVELLHTAPDSVGAVAASALPGTRLGSPARFLLTLADGRRVSAVAKVTADVPHLVATRDVARDEELTGDVVEWIDGPIDGQLLESLPTPALVLGARARRAIVRGEVLTSTIVKMPPAVRAGDPVTLVIRIGALEVRGSGRAVSSGAVGDVIRVMRPSHRDPLRGRITEPAVVEILR